MSKKIKGLRRNIIVYKTVRFLFGRLFKRIYRFSYTPYKPQSDSFILVANHTNAVDPLLEGIAFPQYLRYVASEHLLRKGFVAAAIRFLVNPIPKRRGGDSAEAVRMIIDTLQSGVNVCIHAEGYVSINGETGYISPNTAKMVKDAGAAMLIYRFTGGYFCRPRWSDARRRGPIHGEVVREYTQEDIAKMSLDEIDAAIRGDLYVNAFDVQRSDPKKYKGKKLAEHLETLLYVCPVCKQIGTMHSRDNELFCECGYKLIYNEYGFFEGENLIFDNALDWDKWQVRHIKEILPELKDIKDKPVCSDEKQLLFIISGKDKVPLEEECVMKLYPDRLEFSGENTHVFSFDTITHMAMGGSTRINFTCGSGFYEVNSKIKRSALKYYVLFRLLSGEEYYN